ncbi:MAG: DUF4834 family protein [Bacteroidales bacterium]
MLTLIKIFFFFILIVFIVGFISRYLLGRYFKNLRDNMNQQYQNNQKKNKREGDVYIKWSDKKNKKHFKKDEGEYIDYEELDE